MSEHEGMVELPDGSGCFVGSFPLPKDHWLTQPRCEDWDEQRQCVADVPVPILGIEHRDVVIAAVRYGLRGATGCKDSPDLDPDALVANVVLALCGPYSLGELSVTAVGIILDHQSD